MANSLPFNSSSVFCGLGTATITLNSAQAGIVSVEVQASLPYDTGSSNNSSVTSGGSSLQVLVKLNSVTKMTLSSPSPTQPMLAGKVSMLCVATDVIDVILSSSAAADNQLNSVKTMINVYAGS